MKRVVEPGRFEVMVGGSSDELKKVESRRGRALTVTKTRQKTPEPNERRRRPVRSRRNLVKKKILALAHTQLAPLLARRFDDDGRRLHQEEARG